MSSPVLGRRWFCPSVCALALLLPAAAAHAQAHALPIIASTASDTPPHITAKLTSRRPRSRTNWWLAPVTVTFTCTVGSTPLEGSCPHPVTLAKGGRRESVTASITDTDEQKATVTVSRINIDIAGPKVSIDGPKANHVYAGHAPAAHCEAIDRLSGVTSCRIKKTVKRLQKRERVTITAVAIARSGASASTHLTYEVSAGSHRAPR
jgi:hypothetical protein